MSPTDSEIQNQTILVTGGAGFIGSHLVDRLNPDNDVRILDDFRNATDYNIPSEVEVIEGDIRNEKLLSAATDGIDIIFHQAAIVSVEQSIDDPITSEQINVGGTLALLEAARKENARLVYASSTAIYGEPSTIPVSESHPTNPQSPYGAQKLSGDVYVRMYSDIYDLETIALRYFNVFGPRQSGGPYGGVISIFTDQAVEGRPLTIEGDGTQTRDFVHVKDIVQANILAAATNNTGKSYNVGTGNETSVLELAEIIQEITDTKSEIVYDKPRPGDVKHSCANIDMIQQELGFNPTVDLTDGLSELIHLKTTK